MRISMDMHRPAEALVGFLLIALPFGVAMGSAAMILSVVLGATLVALAYGGWREGDAIPVSTHRAIDRLVAAGTGFAALVALVAAQILGAVLLALLALAMAALVYFTHYRAERPQRATTATWDHRRHGGARG